MTETITVLDVIEKKGFKFIKDAKGTEYMVSKYGTHPAYVPGKSYEVEIEVRQNGDFTNRYIKGQQAPKEGGGGQKTGGFARSKGYSEDDKAAFAKKDDAMAKMNAYNTGTQLAVAITGYFAAYPDKLTPDQLIRRVSAIRDAATLNAYKNITGKDWEGFEMEPTL